MRRGDEEASTSEPHTFDTPETESTASQDTHSYHSASLAGSDEGSPTARQAMLPQRDLTPEAVAAASAAAEAPELQQLSSEQQHRLAALLDTAIMKVRPRTFRATSASWSGWQPVRIVHCFLSVVPSVPSVPCVT